MENVRFEKAADLMHKGVEMISGNATVGQALEKMKRLNVSSLIVERRSPEDGYGIITKKDIVTQVIDPGPRRRNFSETHVHEIMSKPLIMVSPGLAIKYCVRLMSKAGVTRVPVFDGQQILGILSMTDVFDRAAEFVRQKRAA